MSSLEAVGSTVVLKPIEQDEKRNGIIIPNSSKEYNFAEVVSSACEEVSNGDKVFTFFNCGNELQLEGQKYYLIDKQYIHGKLK